MSDKNTKNNFSSSSADMQKSGGPKRGPGGPGIGMAAEKAKDFKGTLKKLLKYLGAYKIAILIAIIVTIASTVFAIVGPKILGNATDVLFDGIMAQIAGTGSIDFVAIGEILLFLLALYVASLILSGTQGLIMSFVSTKIGYRMRDDLIKKIHRLPFSYYDNTTNGEVLSRITNDVDSITQNFNMGIRQLISSTATVIGILYMMFSISWQMTIVALITLPLSGLIVVNIVKRSQKFFKNQQKYLGKVNGLVEENYSCHNIVKAFNGQEKSLEEFEESNKILYESAWKANFMSGLMMPVMSFIGNLGYVGVCILGGYLASMGAVSVGEIQSFLQYVRQFNQPIAQLSQISNVFQIIIAASERIFEFLESEEEVPEIANAHTIRRHDDKSNDTDVVIDGSVEFKNVNFGYVEGNTIINDFTSSIKPGEKIAIVGPTGAGKTTIVKLLMRFYDINGGEILIDGYNIKDFERDELRSAFGMVLQDTWLYNGSIEDNIKYGNRSATKEQVIEAAKAAQVDHFVRTLPDGYDMILNEEAGNVSQGQKQLLTIARAILADPKILILDEATSSVDTRTETLIQKAMDNLMEGRTSFVIAHRLSTIKNADRILVLDKGDVIEQGNHEELMKKAGFYANLYNSQFSKV